MIKIDDDFYIRRRIKQDDIYSHPFAFDMDTLFNRMYCDIKNINLFENRIDDILARYNNNVLDIDCIGELQYYLNGNHFISI